MRTLSARSYALAILSGVLQILPFPIAGPVPLWRTIFCWFALVPLLAALISEHLPGKPVSLREGFILGYVSGFIWYLGNCYWIYQTMYLYGGIPKPVSAGILLLFCLYLGLYHGLFGLLVIASRRASISHRKLGLRGALLLAPFAWVAVEYARATITGFPWDTLGITQVDNPVLTRLAPLTGAYGLSFVIAAVNALWLMPLNLRGRRYTRPALTLGGVAIVVAYVLSARHLQPPEHVGSSATAVLLQENLSVGAAATGPQLTRTELFRTFSQLSEFTPAGNTCNGIPELAATRCTPEAPNASVLNPALAPRPTDLIVWPESPAPFEEGDLDFREALARLARQADAPIIAGDVSRNLDRAAPRGVRLGNSAEFVAPDGQFVGRYDKMHLVPFGEYVPFKRLFFFAGNLLADVGEFSPGQKRSLFTTGGHRYGTFICYESIFGDEVREYPQMGADVLVNISNDGWYGDTSAAWEHLNMVRMRAIENHRWILRATNTGVTAAIDPYGRVVQAAPRHIRTSLRVGFDYEHDLTFYTRHGDWFAWICCASVTLVLAAALFDRTRPKAVCT